MTYKWRADGVPGDGNLPDLKETSLMRIHRLAKASRTLTNLRRRSNQQLALKTNQLMGARRLHSSKIPKMNFVEQIKRYD